MQPSIDIGTRFHFHDGAMTVERSQDCTPILEDAKMRHNQGLHGSSELKHAARLPSVLIEKYCNLNALTFHEFMSNPAHVKTMLNDPDLSGFRIWGGRV